MSDLEAPGAGLPRIERFVAGCLIRGIALLRSRASIDRMLNTETSQIVALCQSISPERGREQVLIDRIIGIEDSSRDWSVYMTVQHLCITTAAMQNIIESLTGGERFHQVVRIEDVKPDPAAGPEVIEEFQHCIDDYRVAMANIGSFSTGERYDHPWFGPINAKQWASLAAAHTRIHRNQIEDICEQL